MECIPLCVHVTSFLCTLSSQCIHVLNHPYYTSARFLLEIIFMETLYIRATLSQAHNTAYTGAQACMHAGGAAGACSQHPQYYSKESRACTSNTSLILALDLTHAVHVHGELLCVFADDELQANGEPVSKPHKPADDQMHMARIVHSNVVTDYLPSRNIRSGKSFLMYF